MLKRIARLLWLTTDKHQTPPHALQNCCRYGFNMSWQHKCTSRQVWHFWWFCRNTSSMMHAGQVGIPLANRLACMPSHLESGVPTLPGPSVLCLTWHNYDQEKIHKSFCTVWDHLRSQQGDNDTREGCFYMSSELIVAKIGVPGQKVKGHRLLGEPLITCKKINIFELSEGREDSLDSVCLFITSSSYVDVQCIKEGCCCVRVRDRLMAPGFCIIFSICQ